MPDERSNSPPETIPPSEPPHRGSLRIPSWVDVLKRYPVAPRGGARVGELFRQLDVVAPVIPDGVLMDEFHRP
jgi:hypothetical protein